jgi:hypothetical protein
MVAVSAVGVGGVVLEAEESGTGTGTISRKKWCYFSIAALFGITSLLILVFILNAAAITNTTNTNAHQSSSKSDKSMTTNGVNNGVSDVDGFRSQEIAPIGMLNHSIATHLSRQTSAHIIDWSLSLSAL